MQKQNRTDRILIVVAIAIFILASGLFYFDNWMWGGRKGSGGHIGIMFDRSGDVRVKFDGDIKWTKATPGQEVDYNDSVYAGPGSQAQLQLGQSEMTVSENTLVVLRREKDTNFMNLAYGSIFGKIGKNEKVIIETGEGKPIELTSSSKSSVIVRKAKNGKTELEVKSGEVNVMIAGKKTKVTQNTRISLEPKAQPKIEKVALELVRPLSSQVVYSDDPARLNFVWKWSNGRQPAAADKYVIEFSSSPGFETVVKRRDVVGHLNTALTASETLSMYYRIRGPAGEISSIEKVNFVRMHKPLILKPVANTLYHGQLGRKSQVEIEFNRPARATVWFQISNDPKFNSVLSVDNTPDPKVLREFAPGSYFIRAKSDYGDNHETGWTLAIPFQVEQPKEGLRLGQFPTGKVLIPNNDYPRSLYKANPDKVKDYLARHGFLRGFFPGTFDRVNMKFSDETSMQSQAGNAWPQDKMYPAKYGYVYQIERAGYEASPWSPAQKLEIAMQAPFAKGEPTFGELSKTGEREVRWAFTPLLYARSYDVQLASNPEMRGAREWRVRTADAKASIKTESYWRARARDSKGNVISDYSRVYKITPPAIPVPSLARNVRERKPAAVEKTTEKVERIRETPFEKNGWWAWFGMGTNFIDYRQSNRGVGSIEDHRVKTPSQYFEVGFLGKGGFGGVFSTTRTPGQINPNTHGSTIDNTSYTWTSIGAEGVLQKTSPFTLLGTPILYGMRLGLQQHKLPYVHINSLGNIELKSNTSTNASAGLLAEWSQRRWTYYWMMRYQYPLSTSADGSSEFSVKPVFTFDGSVGTAYNFTRQLKGGLFWSGQWHQFNFQYGDGTVVNSGFQSLFYSNLDFRLGWDF